MRLTKSPSRYLETRDTRRELSYEAMLASGRTSWSAGDRVRVYRTQTGSGGVVRDADEAADDPAVNDSADCRDYDIDHYVRLLRDTFAARLARAFTPEDFAAVFADPEQLSLFTPSLATMRTVLNRQWEEEGMRDEG